MTTAIQNFRIASPTPRAKPARAGFMGKNIWAMGDQALISASNFVTMVVLARSLGAEKFGSFTLCYSALLFANIFQSTLITQPHGVLGSSRSGEAYRRFTASLGAVQLMLALAQAVVALAVGAYAHHSSLVVSHLLIALAPTIVGWQCQEFTRRVLYTESRYLAAFINDCVSYGGQTLLVLALWWTNWLREDLAMYAVATTSLLAALVGVWQIRHSFTPKFDRHALRESWDFGKWLTGGELLQWCGSLQMYLYLSATLLGVAAAGELRAAQILFGPTRVFAFYLGSVLPIRFSKALSTGGHAAVHLQLREVGLRVVPLLGAYALLVAVFAKPLLAWLYHSDIPGQAIVLVIYSGAAFAEYVQLLFASALSAKRLTRSIFLGQLCGIVMTGLMSWWIILHFGIVGAPMSLGVSASLIAVLFWRTYRESMKSESASAVLVAPEARFTRPARVAPAAAEPSTSSPDRVRLLKALLESLSRYGVPYCITHNHASLATDVPSDVDCVIPASFSRKRLIAALNAVDGARVVFHLDDRSDFIVVADRSARSPALVALHVSPNFELDDRIYYTGEEILAATVERDGVRIAKPEIEFACVLLNRAAKGDLTDAHAARLAKLFKQAPECCGREVRRHWSEPTAAMVLDAIRQDNWAALRELLPQLATESRQRRSAEQRAAVIGRKSASAARRIHRWARPRAGFHVVFLGPDGVGKSTVIERVREAISPAFFYDTYHTFAPSLIPNKFQPEKPTPHALPPRSFAVSLVKAAWWSVCYTAGYLATIHPDRARGGLAVNHRYLLDAIVDPKRYRYSGPTWMLRAIWRIAPKPDLVFLLDAPVEVIQSRKKEVPFEETARQCEGYRALISGLPYGRIINAARSIDEVVADVNEIILKTLANRVAPRTKGAVNA